MLLFDSIIGNNDRHDENWGICVKINPINLHFRLAPFYDNANCLTALLPEEKVLNLLKSDEKLNKYVNNSKPPNLYLSESDSKKYNHFEIIRYLIEQEEDTRQMLAQLLEIDYINHSYAIMKEILLLDVPDKYKLSNNRIDVSVKILEKRKQILERMI